VHPLVAIAIAVVSFRVLGYVNKYLGDYIPVPEFVIDFGPYVLAGFLAWDDWALAVAGSFFAVMLLSVLDVGRDVLMMTYVQTVQGRRRR
jgi:ABC-type xylose transport system permease subunit